MKRLRLLSVVAMKKTGLILFLLLTVSTALGQNLNWAKTEGNVGYFGYFGYGGNQENVQTDNNGNVYTCGQFKGTVDFDQIKLTATGSYDSYIIKRDSTGSILWAKSIAGSGVEYGLSLTLDKNENVYVTGWYYGNTNISGTLLTSVGSYDGFIVKYNKNGVFQFAKQFAGAGFDYPSGLCTDDSGFVYITGSYQHTISFGSLSLSGNASSSAFLAKMNPQGNFIWAKRIGPSSGNYWGSGDVEIDKNRNIYVSGSIDGSAQIGNTYLNTSSQTGFIARCDPDNGTPVWAKKCGLRASTMAIDYAGDVYVAGELSSTADSFDTKCIPNNINSQNNYGCFIGKFNSTGSFIWVKKFARVTSSSNLNDNIRNITTDDAGYAYVSGSISGSADNGSVCGFYLPSTSYGNIGDAFLIKLDPNGNCMWTARSASTVSGNFTNYFWGAGVAADRSGLVYWSTATNNNDLAGTAIYFNYDTIGLDTLYFPTNVYGMYLWNIREPYVKIGQMSQKSFCPGDSIEIPYYHSDPLNWGNIFSVQLSSATGSFLSPHLLGQVIDTANGVFKVALPPNLPSGNSYRVRVNSSNPLIYGHISEALSMNPVPLTNAGPDISICHGDTVQIFASGGTDFKWLNPYKLSADTGSAPYAYPEIDTVYFLQSVDSNTKCINFDTVQVRRKLPPSVFAQGDSAVCTGGSATLTCYGLGGDSLKHRFDWYDSVSQNFLGSGDTLTISPLHSTTYLVVLSDSCSLGSDSAYVQVKIRPPLFAGHIPDTLVCHNENIQIYSIPQGGLNTAYTYRWENLEDNSLLSTQPSFSASFDTSTQVRLILDDGCSDKSDTGLFTISTRSKPKISVSADTIICLGEAAQLRAEGSGGYTSAYLFTWDNGGGTGSTINVFPNTDTRYKVVFTDNCSSPADSAYVHVSVRKPLSLQIRSDSTICKGEEILLFMEGFANDSFYYSFDWNHGVGPGNYLPVKADQSTTYRVKITDNCTLNETFDSVFIAVRDILKISPCADTLMCLGETANLHATATGGFAPAYSYLWSDATGTVALAPGVPFSVSPATTTAYKVKIIDNCTELADSAIITVQLRDPLEVSVSNDTILCYGSSVQIEAFAQGGYSANYSYTWDQGLGNGNIQQVQPNITTQYTVVAQDGCSPADTANVILQILQPLQLSMPPDTIVCFQQQVSLEAQASGGDGNYIFWWEHEPAPAPATTVNVLVAQYYTLTLDDNCSLPISDSVFVDVAPLPDTSFSLTPEADCAPVEILLKSNYDQLAATRLWEFGDGTGKTVANSDTATHIYPIAGTYNIRLKLWSGQGCLDSSSFKQLTVHPVPKAEFHASPEFADIENPVARFINTSTGASAYRWEFGDGTASSDPNPVHSYADTGRYPVVLRVFNNFDCEHEVSAVFRVKDIFTAFIPTAFTPNKNGNNDLFGPYGTAIESFSLKIYDRWGAIIFDNNYKGTFWDGTWQNSGHALPEGVYFYMIEIDIAEAGKKPFKGTVLLLR